MAALDADLRPSPLASSGNAGSLPTQVGRRLLDAAVDVHPRQITGLVAQIVELGPRAALPQVVSKSRLNPTWLGTNPWRS